MNNSQEDHKLDPLIVSLDIDETLVFVSETPFDYRGETFEFQDVDGDEFYGSVRPGARELIDHLFGHKDRFIVGVYSASTESYVRRVIDELMTDDQKACLAFVMHRENTRKEVFYDHVGGWGFSNPKPILMKDIHKVRRRVKRASRDRIVALDDKITVWQRSYGNVLPVPEFNADTLDDEVMRGAVSALDLLSGLDDVRPIEKRGMVIRHANRMKEKNSLSFG